MHYLREKSVNVENSNKGLNNLIAYRRVNLAIRNELTVDFSVLVEHRHYFLARHTGLRYVRHINTGSGFKFLFGLISRSVHRDGDDFQRGRKNYEEPAADRNVASSTNRTAKKLQWRLHYAIATRLLPVARTRVVSTQSGTTD